MTKYDATQRNPPHICPISLGHQALDLVSNAGWHLVSQVCASAGPGALQSFELFSFHQADAERHIGSRAIGPVSAPVPQATVKPHNSSCARKGVQVAGLAAYSGAWECSGNNATPKEPAD
jgi:hypothetical protein